MTITVRGLRLLAGITVLLALPVILGAQDYYRGGGSLANAIGNLGVSHLNSGTGASSTTFWRGDGTWATAGGGGTVTLANGSVLSDTANGQFMMADSIGTDAGLYFGNNVNYPRILVGSGIFRIQRQNTSGIALQFGQTRPASCSPGDFYVDGSGSLGYGASICNPFTEWIPLGGGVLPTSVVGGTMDLTNPTGSPSQSFRVTISGTPTQITFSLPAAHTEWNCDATNLTATIGHRADRRVAQLSGSTTAVVLESQVVSTGAAAAFVAADVVAITCHGA